MNRLSSDIAIVSVGGFASFFVVVALPVLLHILAANVGVVASEAAFEAVAACCSVELAEVASVVVGFASFLLSFGVANESNSGVVRSDGDLGVPFLTL